jgi:DNA-binding NarL/FixJ family response regulator
MSPDDLVAAGREALSRGAWEDARAKFEAAVAHEETPEAQEGLGMAAWWLDDAVTTFDARERGYRLYVERGDRQAAARLAIMIAEDCLDFRGEAAIANGWRERARRLLAEVPIVPERGWLALWEGHFALLAGNDPVTARAKATEAADVGRELKLVDLEMPARALEGLALVSEGRVSEGLARLDEATIAATSGEMHDFVAIGVSCCYLINACERIRDFDRAAQWCKRVKELCRRWRLQSLFALCRTHYASVLMWHGEWAEAEAELLAASQELATVRPALKSEALVRLAELRRRQGRFDEAEGLLREAEGHPLALLVSSALALDRGDSASAADLSERALRGMAPENQTERVAALELRARASLAQSNKTDAAPIIAELRSAAEAIGTDPIRATARRMEGLLAVEDEDPDRARRLLEDAVDLFHRAGAPFESAACRVELARLLARLGRRQRAEEEARRAEALLHSLRGQRPPIPPRTDGPLTARERQVLALVAQGGSNAAIAGHLGVSEFTIKRHVANILMKLDLSSRTAAAAYAAKHDLI